MKKPLIVGWSRKWDSWIPVVIFINILWEVSFANFSRSKFKLDYGSLDLDSVLILKKKLFL